MQSIVFCNEGKVDINNFLQNIGGQKKYLLWHIHEKYVCNFIG
jgi:hypothetical protein